MILWVLAYLGGLLTILSPCILPVLPFVFSSAQQPFRKSGLPLLGGMAVTFAAVSSLAVVGGAWVIHANEWGRWIALALLSVCALTLIFPSLAEMISRPFARLGGAWHPAQAERLGVGSSFLLGIATGLLWAPCAGPVLGLILTSAAIHGANAGTTILLLAYAMGAATSLAAALLVGGKALGLMRTYLGADAWVRKILGTAVLVGVLAIALGWDRGTLTARSRLHAESLEQTLVQVFRPDTAQTASGTGAPAAEGVFPELDGAVAWINSPPLTPAALRGKVVLIDFWTYSCINCLRSLPYLQAWADKYRDVGLVVIGVHTPEFAFERDPANVGKAVQALGITYPVAIDSRYGIWNAFHNQYWPAHYLIDGSGVIRRHHFGEGEHEAAERTIQQLLGELHPAGGVPTGVVDVRGSGAGAPSQDAVAGSLETYIGYERSENMAVVPGLKRDRAAAYRLPAQLALNQWGLLGVWKVQAEDAALARAPGKIVFRFHARDLHLVLGPGAPGRPVHFIVRLDGQPPMKNHGTDTDASGRGVIRDQRLYQLIRQKTTTAIRDRTFEVEFRDPGVQAFAFTFG